MTARIPPQFHKLVSALAILLAGAALFIPPARGAMVTGSITDVSRSPYGGIVNTIQFTPLSCPQAIGTNTVWPVAKAQRLTNGVFTTYLEGGVYWVGIVEGNSQQTPKTVKILVPPNEGTNAWAFNTCANLATNLGTFLWTNNIFYSGTNLADGTISTNKLDTNAYALLMTGGTGGPTYTNTSGLVAVISGSGIGTNTSHLATTNFVNDSVAPLATTNYVSSSSVSYATNSGSGWPTNWAWASITNAPDVVTNGGTATISTLTNSYIIDSGAAHAWYVSGALYDNTTSEDRPIFSLVDRQLFTGVSTNDACIDLQVRTLVGEWTATNISGSFIGNGSGLTNLTGVVAITNGHSIGLTNYGSIGLTNWLEMSPSGLLMTNVNGTSVRMANGGITASGGVTATNFVVDSSLVFNTNGSRMNGVAVTNGFLYTDSVKKTPTSSSMSWSGTDIYFSTGFKFATDISPIGFNAARGIGSSAPLGYLYSSNIFVLNTITPTNGLVLPPKSAAPTWANIGASNTAFIWSSNSIPPTPYITTYDVNSNAVSVALPNAGVRWVDALASGINVAASPTETPHLIAIPGSSFMDGMAYDHGDIASFSVQSPHVIASTNAYFPQCYYEPHVHVSPAVFVAGQTNVTFVMEWQEATVFGNFTNTATYLRTNTTSFTAINEHQLLSFGNVTNNALNGRASVIFRGAIKRIASAANDVGDAENVIVDSIDFHVPVRVTGSTSQYSGE